MTEEKRTLVDDTYLKMKFLIVSKNWGVGSKLPGEEVLAKEFQVSRNTIRSALQKLNRSEERRVGKECRG